MKTNRWFGILGRYTRERLLVVVTKWETENWLRVESSPSVNRLQIGDSRHWSEILVSRRMQPFSKLRFSEGTQ